MKSGAGFTLIELSIVLVIIGLLIGGVLAGKELIHTAEIRATIKQVEQFDAAINAFRTKYNCLPGDCKNGDEFGFTLFLTDGAQNNTEHFALTNAECSEGSGDGMIHDDPESQPPSWSDTGCEEIENAWWWLYQAGLLTNLQYDAQNAFLERQFTKLPTALDGGQIDWWVNNLDPATWNVLYVKTQNLDPNNHFFSRSGHYYWLSADVSWGGIPTAILPSEAYAIDVKLDDGLPRSGKVRASGNDDVEYGDNWYAPISDPNGTVSGLNWGVTGHSDEGVAGATSDYCVTSAATPLYNIQNTSRHTSVDSGTNTSSLCTLTVEASF